MRLTFFILAVFYLGGLWAAPELIKRNTRPLDAESNLDALDPWETPIASFFIRSHHGAPPVSEEWEVEIDGLVDHPQKIKLSDLKNKTQKSFHAVLECSGNGRAFHFPKVSGLQWEKGAVGNAEWSGVSLSDLLKEVGIQPKAKFATIEGADLPVMPQVPPFVRSIPLDKLLSTNAILAMKMNREDLPVLHGGPLRLILPNWYAHNWIKWVRKITFTENEDPGFFMKKGYRIPKKTIKPGEKWDSSTGDPVTALKVQSFILHPRQDEKVSLGPVKVMGKTFSGYGVIEKLELSTDGGKTWTQANLEKPHDTGGWQAFEAEVTAKKLGKMTVMSRATDSSHNVQPFTAEWNPSGYLWNAVDKVVFQVIKKPPQIFPGEELAQEKCLTCHTHEMFDSQKLDRKGWEKVLGKMEAFGVQLTADEKKYLADYFEKRTKTNLQTESVDFYSETLKQTFKSSDKGNSSQGKELYGSYCAACHGENAEGKIGPTLKGRQIPENYFYQVVLKGVRTMPAFGESLTKNQAADIKEFLLQ